MNKIGRKMPAENIKALENFINYCAAKNKIINKNIANVETKNYKREDIDFKDMFQHNINSVLKTTSNKHIGINSGVTGDGEIKVVEDKSEDAVSGINNVDIDNEMAELAENSLKFKFAAKKIGNYYRELQNVIKNGGRL